MRAKSAVLAVLLAASVVFVAIRPAQGTQDTAKQETGDKWDAPRLRQALTELGYEVNNLSEKKFEIKTTREGFDIPVAAEISGSGNYIWLTVFLGQNPTDEKSGRLLRQNFKIQPSQFYVTEKGNLMMAIPVENRAMSNVVLKRGLDKVVDDVAKTASDWQK